MSSAHLASAPIRQSAHPRERSTLRALPTPRPRPRPGYALLAVIGAITIGLAQMVLSTLATEATFRVHELSSRDTAAKLQAQELYEEVAGLSSPQHLAELAADQGLVINAAPSFLRLSDNQILGAQAPAGNASTVDANRRKAVSNLFLENADRRHVPPHEPVVERDPNAPIDRIPTSGSPSDHPVRLTEPRHPDDSAAPADSLPPDGPVTGLPTPRTR